MNIPPAEAHTFIRFNVVPPPPGNDQSVMETPLEVVSVMLI